MTTLAEALQAQDFLRQLHANPWGWGGMPAGVTGEMRGRGPGESRDPYAPLDNTVESRVASGIPDAVMMVNPGPATVGTLAGIGLQALRPDSAQAASLDDVKRMVAGKSPDEIKALQRQWGVDPDGRPGTNTLSAGLAFLNNKEGEAASARAAEANRIRAQGDADAALAKARIEAEVAAKDKEARLADDRAIAHGKKPLAEQYPMLPVATTGVGYAAGAGLAYLMSRGKLAPLAGELEAAQRGAQALKSGRVGDAISSQAEAQAFKGAYKPSTMADTLKGMGVGAATGYEGALLPYEIDALRATKGSDEQGQALESIFDPKRGATAALFGALSAKIGSTAAGLGAASKASRADAALAGLESRLAPDVAGRASSAAMGQVGVNAADATVVNSNRKLAGLREAAGRSLDNAAHERALQQIERRSELAAAENAVPPRMADVLENRQAQGRQPQPAGDSNQGALSAPSSAGVDLSSMLKAGQGQMRVTHEMSPQVESVLSRLLQSRPSAEPAPAALPPPVQPPAAPTPSQPTGSAVKDFLAAGDAAEAAGKRWNQIPGETWARQYHDKAIQAMDEAVANGTAGSLQGGSLNKATGIPSSTGNKQLAFLDELLKEKGLSRGTLTPEAWAEFKKTLPKRVFALPAAGLAGASMGDADAEASSAHHSTAQPRDDGGRFNGPPDRSALDRAIAKAMGSK